PALPCCNAGLGVDHDLARLGFVLLRDLDLENAVAVAGLDRIGIHAARQRERAHERAVRALDAVIALLFLPLELALAADREQPVLEVDAEILLLDARNLDLHDDLVLLLQDVDRRSPGTRAHLIIEEVETAKERLKETRRRVVTSEKRHF